MKSKQFLTSIKHCVLGNSVSKEQRAPDLNYDAKIKNAKPPSNMKQLESLVGLAIFYGRMILAFSTK